MMSKCVSQNCVIDTDVPVRTYIRIHIHAYINAYIATGQVYQNNLVRRAQKEGGPKGRDWNAIQLNGKNRKKLDDVGKSRGADGGGPSTVGSRSDEAARP